ncbi:MAG: hypothetical protein NW224_14090 [Leptolyngbyaceae cyanobacterium bins.302]|nr:hypothetical protein [Leptolyngbyaceae cyanobacterium bins.302]
MRSPWERLKQLPWLVLLQTALLTTIVLLVLEYLLFFSTQISVVRQVLQVLGSPAIEFITLFVVALGVGALAVLILERMKRIAINTASLWGLVACLAIVLLIEQSLGLFPVGLVGIDYPQLIGIVLGIFLKGQPYWKSYRRW